MNNNKVAAFASLIGIAVIVVVSALSFPKDHPVNHVDHIDNHPVAMMNVVDEHESLVPHETKYSPVDCHKLCDPVIGWTPGAGMVPAMHHVPQHTAHYHVYDPNAHNVVVAPPVQQTTFIPGENSNNHDYDHQNDVVDNTPVQNNHDYSNNTGGNNFGGNNSWFGNDLFYGGGFSRVDVVASGITKVYNTNQTINQVVTNQMISNQTINNYVTTECDACCPTTTGPSTSVPEPTAWSLLLVGLIGLVLVRRRVAVI